MKIFVWSHHWPKYADRMDAMRRDAQWGGCWRAAELLSLVSLKD